MGQDTPDLSLIWLVIDTRPTLAYCYLEERYRSKRTMKPDSASHHADFVLSCLPIPSWRFLGTDDDYPNASNIKGKINHTLADDRNVI